MNYQEFRDRVFECAQACGLTEYELYYRQSRAADVGVFGGEVKGFSSSDEAEACFRCVCGGHIGSSSTSLFTEEEAGRLVQSTMENAAVMEKEEPVVFCGGGLVYEKPEPKLVNDISTSRMIDIAKEELALCRSIDEKVTDNSETGTVIEHTVTCLDNSRGVHLYYQGHMGAVIVQAAVRDGDDVGFDVGFRYGSPEEIDLKDLAQETVRKAMDTVGADVPESGVFPVVLSPEAMTSLLGTFSPAFSGENALNGLSLMKGKEGTKVAAECITVMDNPFYEESYRRIPFDGEGTPARCKAVIENGVLNTLLYDLAAASRAGVESTGNASRVSVSSPITVRPSNFYIQPGDASAEELYARAGEGILVTSVQGLHAGANVVTGDFSLQSRGFLIRDGKKDRPVKSFTIAGNFYEMLQKAAAVGSDMKFNCLRCFGSPSVLVNDLAVSGK